MRSHRGRVRRRLAAGPVDSRWWYWIAALPLAVGLCAVTVAWLAMALVLGPVDAPDPLARAVELSMITFGVPFLVLTLLLPAAIAADAATICATDVDWRPERSRLVAAALPGPALLVGLVGYALVVTDPVTTPLLAVLAGTLLATPLAAWYLRRRHRRLGVP